MSTDTLVGGDLDVDTFVRALADEPDVICEACDDLGNPCTNTAEWGLTCRGCGSTDVMCDSHRLEFDIWVRHHPIMHSCMTVVLPPPPWRPL